MSEFNLNESPIRKNIKKLKDGQLSVFEEGTIQVRTILQDIENMLNVMKSHGDDVVRIAVMGEVKAGKSTFINALVGKEVAYTDILEATAIVSEITYSEKEYVHLIGKDGNVIREYSFQEMLNWMEDMVDDDGDFLDYEKISIGVSVELLKNLIVVDTPGLLSITSRNHDITNKYVADTDYIIWIINSHNLGSKAVNDCIDKIKLSGKPMIGIINKVDADAERVEIEKYIEKEYSSIFENIFFVSSKIAWELMEAGDDEWSEKAGFDEIYDCIEDITEDKEHSISKTKYYQLQREKKVHIKMRERIKERKNYYDNEIATFSYVNNEIKKTIKKEIKNWCKNEVFVNERQELLNANNEDFHKLLYKYSDSGYITDLIETKYDEIMTFIYHKWNIVTESLDLTSSQVIVDFTYDKIVVLEDEETEREQIARDNAQRIKEGVTKGVAIGVAFAGYCAWLGPAAATISFVGALVPCTIPFIVTEVAISGLIIKGSEGKVVAENAKKKLENVDDLYKEVMKVIVKESDNMQSTLLGCSDHYYEEQCSEYRERTAQFNFDFTDPAFKDFLINLDNYIEALNKEIELLGRSDIPEPPEENEIKRG